MLLNIEILEDINKQTKARQRILLHDINKNADEQAKITEGITAPESVAGPAIAENIAGNISK